MSSTKIPKYLTEDFRIKYPDWVKIEKLGDRDVINKYFMPSLKVKNLGIGQAVSYHFVFDEPFGWAIFTINDATGEFSIQSDWGNYSHRWNINNLGNSHNKYPMPLTHFLGAGNDASYVCDKLHYGRNDKEVYSINKTVDAFKKELLEKRRSLSISQEQAKDAWYEIKNTIDFNSPNDVYSSIVDTELNKIIYDVYENIRYEISASYTILEYKLLPFFFQYLRREILKIEDNPDAVIKINKRRYYANTKGHGL